MPSDDSRDTILRRRKFFVRSALGSAITVLTACPQQGSRETPSQTPTATVPAVATTVAPEPVPTTEPEPDPSVLPRLDVPEGVNPTARRHYERLAEVVPQIHQHLDAADKAIASLCDVVDPACSGGWSEVAQHLEAVEDLRIGLPPRCPGSSADAKAFDERLALHQKIIGERVDDVQFRLEKLLKTAAQKKRWEEHRQAASVPRPCLKFRCDDW